MNKIVFGDYKFSIDVCDSRDELLNAFIYIEEPNKSSSFFVNIDFKKILDTNDLCVNIKNGKNISNDILICRLIDRTIRPIIRNIKLTLNITCLEYNYSKVHAVYAAFLAFNYISKNSVHFFWIEGELNLFVGHYEGHVLSIEMSGNEVPVKEIAEHVEKALSTTLPEFKRDNLLIMDENSNIDICKSRPNDRPDLDIREINIVNHHRGDSVLFTRGDTSVLTQMHFNIFGENESVFNYDFGNNRKNRREVGHSDLIRKSFESMIPKFLQINSSSYVQNCNGSSSMASVCGLSMCLKNLACLTTLVGGITVGCYFKTKTQVNYILDITGKEDEQTSFMDMKCAGTHKGFNAIQMDCKKLYKHKFKKVFTIAQNGINHVLKKMAEKVFKHSQFFKEYVLDKSRVGVFIGSNGKKIKKISQISNTMVRVDKEGRCVAKHDNFRVFEQFYNFYNYCDIKEGKLVVNSDKIAGVKNFSLILKEKYLANSEVIHTSFGELIVQKPYEKDIEKDEAISILLSKSGHVKIERVYS